VLEDSPNGIRAAHTAGLRVVGVPNPVTATLALEAELVLSSLEELPLEDILRRVDGIQPLEVCPPLSRMLLPRTPAAYRDRARCSVW